VSAGGRRAFGRRDAGFDRVIRGVGDQPAGIEFMHRPALTLDAEAPVAASGELPTTGAQS